MPPPGSQQRGPNPTDRGKRGTKRHLVVNGDGIPLVCLLSGANRHDSQFCAPAVNSIPSVKGKRGRPCKRPRKLYADKGYDYPFCRRHLHKLGITLRIARRGVESKEHFGRHCWIIERTLSWLNQFRKLRIRYERSADAYLALCKIAYCLIAIRFVDRICQ